MLGLHLPTRVRQLAVFICVASLLAGIATFWAGLPVAQWVGLTPARVWTHGAVWQLVTYPWFVLDPIGLVTALVTFGWFAGDLELAWGSRGFLDRLGLLVVTVGLAMLGASLAWPELRDVTLIGPWPLFHGLLVAWGFTFPEREIRVGLGIRLTGARLAWMIIILVLALLAFGGPETAMYYVPLAVSVGVGVAYGRTSWSFRRK